MAICPGNLGAADPLSLIEFPLANGKPRKDYFPGFE
jgi:hypothetical protein